MFVAKGSAACLCVLVVLVATAAATDSAHAPTVSEQKMKGVRLKTLSLPLPPTEELANAFRIFAHDVELDAEGERLNLLLNSLSTRGQCNSTAYLALHILRRDPMDYFAQNHLFESLLMCEQAHITERFVVAAINSALEFVTERNTINSTLTLHNFVNHEDDFELKEWERYTLAMANLVDWKANIIILTSAGKERHEEVASLHRRALQLGGNLMAMFPVYCQLWHALLPGFDALAAGAFKSVQTAEQVLLNRTEPSGRGWQFDDDSRSFWEGWAPEMLAVGKLAQQEPNKKALAQVIQETRALECSWDFIHDHLKNAYTMRRAAVPKSSSGSDLPPNVYSPNNHQYGTFSWAGFQVLAQHPLVKQAMHHVRQSSETDDPTKQLRFYVMGSNVGNEAFYSSLGFSVPTVGVELQCRLVKISKSLKEKFAPDAPVEFRCEDALTTDVHDAGVVYLDNQAWDEMLDEAMRDKLVRELPLQALVITTVAWAVVEAENTAGQLRHIAVAGSELAAGAHASWRAEFRLYKVVEGAAPTESSHASFHGVADTDAGGVVGSEEERGDRLDPLLYHGASNLFDHTEDDDSNDGDDALEPRELDREPEDQQTEQDAEEEDTPEEEEEEEEEEPEGGSQERSDDAQGWDPQPEGKEGDDVEPEIPVQNNKFAEDFPAKDASGAHQHDEL